jgi:apolipoprotein N-acyltransferase
VPGLSVVALAPLFLLLGTRRPARWGWLHGIATWCAAVPWIVHTLTLYGHLPGPVAGLALLLLAAFLGLYHALFAALGARLWRRGGALALSALPALWVLLELLRAKLLTGFPWNLAAYAWTDVPGALPAASWFGAYGVSALVVLPGLGLARAWATRRWETWAAAALIPAIVLPAAARFARTPPAELADSVRDLVRIAIVQPDTPDRPLFDAAENEADYRRLLDATRTLCAPGTLVVWPESAAWPREWQGDARLRDDVAALTADGCDLLLNTPWEVGPRVYNSVVLVAAGAVQGRADKRHLVPFGEYVPLRSVFPFLGKIARMVGDFAAADHATLIDWNGQKLGLAVCYEVIFPGEVADLVRSGATLLVTVTNDGWYGDTAAPHQHLRAARFRAAEERRWLLRAAITGISAVVRPDGSLAGIVDVGREGSIVSGVVGRRDLTPYGRAPWLVPLVAVLWFGAVSWWTRRRASAR